MAVAAGYHYDTAAAVPAGGLDYEIRVPRERGLEAAKQAAAALAAAVAVPQAEQEQWIRHVIPLPKQIVLGKKLEVLASDVKLTLRKRAGEVEQAAADELRALFKEKANADLSQGKFEILMGVCDAAGKLDGVPVPGA